MKTTSRALFAIALLFACGCAITDYAPIVDNNQTSEPGEPRQIIDTRGKAKLIHASQWATQWSDGVDENLNFVNQDASGGQTHYSHLNFSVAGDATFSDDLYCSPETKGCAASKTFDVDAADPDEDRFDGKYGRAECPGARSLCLLISTGRYYGECGRTGQLSVTDRLNLWNVGRLAVHDGLEVLMYDVNRSNFTITLDNGAGVVASLPISGSFEAWTTLGSRPARRSTMTNPLLAQTGRAYADWLHRYGTASTAVIGCYNDVCREWSIAGNQTGGEDEVSTPARVLDFVARHF